MGRVGQWESERARSERARERESEFGWPSLVITTHTQDSHLLGRLDRISFRDRGQVVWSVLFQYWNVVMVAVVVVVVVVECGGGRGRRRGDGGLFLVSSANVPDRCSFP